MRSSDFQAVLAAAIFLAAVRDVGAQPGSIRARFACNDGKSIDATFVKGPKSRVELVLSDGRKLTLPQARSGSGARYANANESFVFWNKGDTAFIEENGKTTYDGCVTRR
ncbi:MAG TPA: MliC family protein [Casimicrobiaceae bacterium]|nr:MliC family protein [Casimicrobiaceae bacterium]